MPCSLHTYLRGKIFWWRSRVTFQGEKDVIALSLRTRDSVVAEKIARRVSVECERMQESQSTDAAAAKAALEKFALYELACHEERFATKLADLARRGSAAPGIKERDRVTPDEQAYELRARARDYRIYGAMDKIIAKKGPIKAAPKDRLADPILTPEEERQLADDGLSQFEIDKIIHKLERGYGEEAFKSSSPVAGTPPGATLGSIFLSFGAEPNDENMRWAYGALARNRVNLSGDFAKRYDAAANDLYGAIAAPRPDIRKAPYFDGRQYPMPAFEGADAFAKGNFDVHFLSQTEGLVRRAPAPKDPPGERPSAKADAEEHHEIAAPDRETKTDIERRTELEKDSQNPDNEVAEGAAHLTSTEPVALIETKASEGLSSSSSLSQPPQPSPNAAGVPSRRPGDASREKSLLDRPTTIDDLALRVKTWKANDWREDTFAQAWCTADLFFQVVGSRDLDAVDSSHFGLFIDALGAIPTNYGKSPRSRAKSLKELLRDTAHLDASEVGLSITTKNRHLTYLRAWMTAAEQRGYKNCGVQAIPKNQSDDRDEEEKASAFTVDDVKTLLKAETWSSGADGAIPSLYFIPIIAAYSGARSAELAGLLKSDIDTENLVIQIRPNKTENRKLKNKNSERRVPILQNRLQ